MEGGREKGGREGREGKREGRRDGRREGERREGREGVTGAKAALSITLSSGYQPLPE